MNEKVRDERREESFGGPIDSSRVQWRMYEVFRKHLIYYKIDFACDPTRLRLAEALSITVEAGIDVQISPVALNRLREEQY